MTDHIECLEHRTGECAGAVEYRHALSATGKSYPRCDKHWDRRLEEQERITRTYFRNPADAEESW